MNIRDALLREHPWDGFSLAAIYRLWASPIDTDAIKADVPVGTARPVLNATVRLGDDQLIAEGKGVVNVTPFPGVPHEGDLARYIYGFVLIGPDDIVVPSLWNSRRRVERGEELEVSFRLMTFWTQ